MARAAAVILTAWLMTYILWVGFLMGIGYAVYRLVA